MNTNIKPVFVAATVAINLALAVGIFGLFEANSKSTEAKVEVAKVETISVIGKRSVA
jgi:hypothetical protein